MNVTHRKTHDVQQGTGAWLRLREGFNTASEAPAALGVSKYVSRAELMRHKHTGIAPEHSAATLGKFAAGHAAEADARPLAEKIVNGDLYPVTMSAFMGEIPLLASLDGLTLDGSIAWETKLWNEDLAAAVRAGALPEHYTVQMDQELLVSGAERCLFTCTDGTPERFVHCWYQPSPERFAALVAGWAQFEKDLAAYVLPTEAPPAAVGKAPDQLPALRIEVTGQVTASNLAEFKATALGAIRSVNRELTTDQHFADAEKAVKWCAEVEIRLDAAKQHALSQTASIDALFKAIDDISAEARRVRLDLDKLVTRRKLEVKEAEVLRARDAMTLHVEAVNAEIAPARLSHVVAFGDAIKGLKTIDSVRAKLDAALAAGKIEVDAKARDIRANLAAYRSTVAGFEFLFADLAVLLHQSVDDFSTLVGARIANHQAQEAEKARQREEAERQRIAAAEQRAREQEAARQEDLRRHEAAVQANAAAQTAAALAHAAAPASVPLAPASVPQMARIAHGIDEPATLTLGAINARLGFVLTSAFVVDVLRLQPPAYERGMPRFCERDFTTICTALIRHVSALELAVALAASPALAPAEVARQPLTDQQIENKVRGSGLDWSRGWTLDDDCPNRYFALARAIERAHGIGSGNDRP